MTSVNHADGSERSARLDRNAILAALTAADLEQLAPHVRIVNLSRGQATNQSDQQLSHVDFPIDAMISIMATFSSGSSCEVALVGREGFVEADAALDHDAVSRTTVCQVGGNVARIRHDVFTEKLAQLSSLERAVRRSLRTRLFITEQIAACNLRHTVSERLARWLLTTMDHLEKPHVSLTQETFAVLLGVRRAGVSEAATALQRLGAVRVERAAINMIDREALVAASCECYASIRAMLDRGLGVCAPSET